MDLQSSNPGEIPQHNQEKQESTKTIPILHDFETNLNSYIPTPYSNVTHQSKLEDARDLEDGLSSSTNGPTGEELQRITTTPSPYYSLPRWRKNLIVFAASITTLCVTFASTSLFPLTAEISETLHTSQGVITASNAIQIFVMGLSGFLWGPIGRIIGRKPAWLAASSIFALTTIGAGLAPQASAAGKTRLNIFLVMRVLSGLEGTTFHVMGQMYIAETFVPTQRGTAAGLYFVGSVFGPAFGPCVSGVMITYLHWTSILWLQAGMMAVSIVVSFFVLPKAPNEPLKAPEATIDRYTRFKSLLAEFDPSPVFRAMIYPNVTLTHLACGLIGWTQYTLFATPRHLLNPRFHLTTPLVSGLFYLAPGVGLVIGTIVGGRFSDMTVRKWITIRGGLRMPQDRLNSGMIAFFLIIPATSLIYGWGLQYEVGGLALPIITAFFCGVGLMLAFTSLNTYCAEVLPKARREVIAGKYLVQYAFAATGSGVIVSIVDAIGVGPAQTIGSGLGILAGVLTLVTAKHGLKMQRWVEKRLGHACSKEQA